MSIFFIDENAKALLRNAKKKHAYDSFSFQKDNTEIIRKQRARQTMQIIPQCYQLKQLWESYEEFSKDFENFNKKNGPIITGVYLSDAYLRFKAAVEPFIHHTTHYFNSIFVEKGVKSFSPIIDFSTQMLREWSRLVTTINRLSQSHFLPQITYIQQKFHFLNDEIREISDQIVTRTFYRDELYFASNSLLHELQLTYDRIYADLSHEEHGIKEEQINIYKNQLVRFLRNIESNYIGILPSLFTSTPRMTRKKSDIKSAVGDIINLLCAAYSFRDDIARLLSKTCNLQRFRAFDRR